MLFYIETVEPVERYKNRLDRYFFFEGKICPHDDHHHCSCQRFLLLLFPRPLLRVVTLYFSLQPKTLSPPPPLGLTATCFFFLPFFPFNFHMSDFSAIFQVIRYFTRGVVGFFLQKGRPDAPPSAQ